MDGGDAPLQPGISQHRNLYAGGVVRRTHTITQWLSSRSGVVAKWDCHCRSPGGGRAAGSLWTGNSLSCPITRHLQIPVQRHSQCRHRATLNPRIQRNVSDIPSDNPGLRHFDNLSLSTSNDRQIIGRKGVGSGWNNACRRKAFLQTTGTPIQLPPSHDWDHPDRILPGLRKNGKPLAKGARHAGGEVFSIDSPS